MKRNSVGHIAGAGLLALDVVICDEHSPEAFTFAGGTCGNVLSILSYFDWTSSAVGVVGNDGAADRVVGDLMSVGVSAKHLVRSTQMRTPVFFQTFEHGRDGAPRHAFSQNCPRCGRASASHATTTPIREFSSSDVPDVFFMDRLSEDILALATSAKAHGATVFYEPSSKSDRHLWARAFELVDIVKYSHDRFGVGDFHDLLVATGSSAWEIQTLGEQGLRYRRYVDVASAPTEWVVSPAVRAPRVVDTCGAGDWCTAGLVYGLVSGKRTSAEHFSKAVRLGQVLAAWACAFLGARGAMYCRDSDSAWQSINVLANGGDVDLSDVPTSFRPSLMRTEDVSDCGAWLCAGG